MADILKNGGDITLSSLLTYQQVLDLAESPMLSVIDKMIPSTSVTVQHGWRLDVLCSLRSASFAFERVMCIAPRFWFELKELSEGFQREVSFNILGRIHDARRK